MVNTRFAPSPTGLLHIGHAVSAWFAWRACGKNPENFTLRIENIDATRCRPEFESALIDDLHWLGLSWVKDVRRQAEHFSEFKFTLDQLSAMGLTYPCFCTRKEIQEEIERSPSAPHGPEGYLYPGICKRLSASEISEKIESGIPYAIRLDTQKALQITGQLRWFDHGAGWQDAQPQMLGDPVLARKDTPASYHLCVTCDDALQHIDLVTRGMDLFHATHLHRLLQALLDLPVPEYHHHPLLLDSQGNRLAKRNKSLTLRDLREKSFSAADLQSMIESQDFTRLPL